MMNFSRSNRKIISCLKTLSLAQTRGDLEGLIAAQSELIAAYQEKTKAQADMIRKILQEAHHENCGTHQNLSCDCWISKL